ncbi:hypothetical protein Godav_028642 [Gossypium davidsonii]|uniref:R13L1/DRL21-like LRR repeat region domain-containing protein n=1 Tax=Gossypium davidsonii TaxID=34287 RepID=A0A7J8S030_GOSDV|nr:hypothetical protein [Gossypium davidsonii]
MRRRGLIDWYCIGVKSLRRIQGIKKMKNGADSSFKNMVSLGLHNCKNCKSLPSIARLSFLKDLSICGLDEVHKIGVELFGANQSNAFASLETLYFCDLPNWEEYL